MKNIYNILWANILLVCSLGAYGQSIADKQLIYQQERQKALEERLTPEQPDISLLPDLPKAKTLVFPTEAVCFNITEVTLRNRQDLPWWLPLNTTAQKAEGHCLGGQGINLLMSYLQNSLISHGFITTRVVDAPQDLATGKLELVLVKGKTRQLKYTDDSDTYAQLFTAMPVREGQILDLRDIEQGLENLQRIPSVSAKMELVPGDEVGESDILIKRQQDKFWRLGASLDDSGARTTGRYQGGLTLYLDNLLSLSDSFYISGGQSVPNKSRYGSNNYMLHYSVPFGYWLLSGSFSKNHYLQTVAGIPQDYQYSGDSKSATAQISRVIYRGETAKTTLSYGVTVKASHNFIDDTEIDIQRRRTTSWQLGLQHRYNIGQNTVNLGVTYQQGVRWFDAQRAPEEILGEGTALAKILRYNASLAVPFTLGEQRLRYTFELQGQHTSNARLTPQDRFSIGGRWSVRGFDGELSLSADRGFYLHNELAWSLFNSQELYLGIDYGRVYGPASEYLLGNVLSGAVLGLRGNIPGGFY